MKHLREVRSEPAATTNRKGDPVKYERNLIETGAGTIEYGWGVVGSDGTPSPWKWSERELAEYHVKKWRDKNLPHLAPHRVVRLLAVEVEP